MRADRGSALISATLVNVAAPSNWNSRSSIPTPRSWMEGFDKNGRPQHVPGKIPTKEGELIMPTVLGATNWAPPSYKPENRAFLCLGLGEYRHDCHRRTVSTGSRGCGYRRRANGPGDTDSQLKEGRR